MLLATFTFALMNVAVKSISHIPAIEIIFFRSIISFAICVALLKWQNVPLLGNNKKLLLIRGAVGSISLYLYFSLLHQIPLATVVTLNYLAPIFTTILGIYIVKEKVASLQWLFFTFAFAGVVVIQGVDVRVSSEHLIIGVLAALLMGIAYNLIRKLNHSEHALVIMLYLPMITLPIAGIVSLYFWVQPLGTDWIYLVVVGLLTQVAQYFMTKSYQSAEINRVAMLKYIGIIYALGFGFFIFDETFNFATYIGMTLVVGGVLMNMFWKRYVENHQ